MRLLSSTNGKVLASVAVLSAAAGVAGLATFGTFTSSTSADTAVSSGTVQIQLGAAGSPDNRLTVGASGLVPGDTVQRAVTLSNTGDQDLSAVSLDVSATASSALDTDATNGLQLTIQSCPSAWDETGTAPAYSYTCSGTSSTVLASRPVDVTAADLSGSAALGAGGTDHLLVTLSLPSTADNTVQGASSTLSFTFTGTQRAGSAH